MRIPVICQGLFCKKRSKSNILGDVYKRWKISRFPEDGGINEEIIVDNVDNLVYK